MGVVVRNEVRYVDHGNAASDTPQADCPVEKTWGVGRARGEQTVLNGKL